MKHPNIIVFMTDHQRGDTVLSGSPVITPNLDRFREQAVTFSNSWCPSPHCCPSRATFFSGLYPSEHGIWNNVDVSNALSHHLYDDIRLFSEDLADVGYRLYFSGKWHVSSERGPDSYGFELLRHKHAEYAPHPNCPDVAEWDRYARKKTDIGDEPRTDGRIVRPGYPSYTQYGVKEDPYKDSLTVQAAVDKLASMDTDEPFFMFVGPLGPHDPYFVPQRFLDMYDPDDIRLPDNFDDDLSDKPTLYRRTKERYSQLSREEHLESIRRFYAFCSYEDELFGRLLDAVEARGLMENTLILYTSDHGDYIGAHGLWAKGLPCFKEAYHVCAVAGGGIVKNGGRMNTSRLSLADWAPTFLELAGAPARPMSGHSLTALLRDETDTEPRAETYTQTNGNEVYGIQRAVWNDRWKYVFNTFDYDELYDLENDPGEMHNLLHGLRDRDIPQSPYGEIVKEMWKKLWAFAREHKDNIVNPYIMTAFAPFGPGILGEELSDAADEH
jgi:choline-sulfatase